MKESEEPEDISTSKTDVQENNTNNTSSNIPKKEYSEFEKYILEAYKKINTIPNITDDAQENIEILNDESQYKVIIKASELDLRCALKCCNEDEKIQFQRFIIDKLNRISLHNLMNINYILGEIYISFMKKNNFFGDEQEKIKINDVIYFINRIVELEECIQATEISKTYQITLADFLNNLIKKCNFDDEQKENLLSYIDNFNENKNFNIITETFKDLVTSLNEELNNQKNIYDQYQIFLDNETEIEEIINDFNLKDKDNYNNVLNLGKYFAYCLYNLTFIFYIKQNEDNNEEGEENENLMKIKKYYDGYPDKNNQIDIIDGEKFYIKNDENIEKLRIKLCELVIKYIEKFKKLNNIFGIQYILFVLIKRIYYYYYDQYINKIKPLIVDVVINLCFFEEAPLYNLSSFINKIIKSNDEKDAELKNLFLSKIEQFKLNRSFLYKLPKNYNKKKNKDDDQDEEEDKSIVSNGSEGVILLSDSNELKIGFMNKEDINAGEINEFYIELSESFCILDFIFQIQDYDINLKITNLTEGKIIYSAEKITDKNCPLKLIMLFINPCILKIEFDNTYSWMKGKQIKYKANVFYSKNPYNLGNNILLTKYVKTIIENKKDFVIDKSANNERILITKIFDDIKVFNCFCVKQNIDIIHKMMKDNYINVFSIFIEISKNNKTKKNFYYLEQNKFIKKELNKEEFEKFITNFILKNSKVNLDIINLYIIKNDTNFFEEYNSIKDIIGFEPVIQISGVSQNILFFPQFLHQSQLLYYLYKNVYAQESFDYVFLINYNKYGGFLIATFIEGRINLDYEKFKKIRNKDNFEEKFEENLEIIIKEIKELSKDRNVNIVVPEFFEIDSDYSEKLINKFKETFEKNENKNSAYDINVKIIKLDKKFNDDFCYISHIFCLS